ncbi:MAG: hypothetical protein ACJA2Q_000207 [Pseudohongiellaceae bacterium]|jgi:hypothetical protein
MIKKSILLSLALLSLTGHPTTLAQSPADGVWNFAMSSQMGSVDAIVTIETDGAMLTGVFDVGGGRTWEMEEGRVDGANISFKINRDGAMMTYVMSGNVDGNMINGTASALGSVVDWSMRRED